MAQDHQAGVSAHGHLDAEIDFFLLITYLRESWRFVLTCVLLGIILTALSLRATPPTYEATMVVAPPVSENGGSGGGVSSLSSVLGSLNGSSAASNPQFDQFQYKMTSPSVVRAANADGQLYAWIYPGLWDPRARGWIKPSGAMQVAVRLVRGFFRKPDWIPPDEVMTSETLSKQILFEAVPKSTLTRVSYQNSNRTIATAMLRRLYSEADRQIRDQERRRLKALMANANVMLSETQIADLRMAMAQQLAQSEYRLMNVPNNTDYSAKQVEAPFVSSLPVSPKIGLSLALAAAIVFVLSSFLAVAYRIVAAEMARRGKSATGKANWRVLGQRSAR
jgi:uncharacterized protein involved in exopolysaccharide biosynthesis